MANGGMPTASLTVVARDEISSGASSLIFTVVVSVTNGGLPTASSTEVRLRGEPTVVVTTLRRIVRRVKVCMFD